MTDHETAADERLQPPLRRATLAAALAAVALAAAAIPALTPDEAGAAATCTRGPYGGQCALFYTDRSGKPNNTTLTTHHTRDIDESITLIGPGHLDATNDRLHRWHVNRSRFGKRQNRTFFKYWRACVMVKGDVWRCTPWVGAGPPHQVVRR